MLLAHAARTAPFRRVCLFIRAVGHVEAALLYRPVERDVLGGLPRPWNHILLRELPFAQLLLAFCGQNAVNECEGVAVAVVMVFFVPYKTRTLRGEGWGLKAAQAQAVQLPRACRVEMGLPAHWVCWPPGRLSSPSAVLRDAQQLGLFLLAT